MKYEISDLKLPAHVVAAIGLLEPLRIAGERLRLRKMSASWNQVEIVEEALTILRERSERIRNPNNRPA